MRTSNLYRSANISRSFHALNGYHQRGFRQARPSFREEYKDPFPPPSKKGIFFGGAFFAFIMLFGSGMVTPSDLQQWEPIGRDKDYR